MRSALQVRFHGTDPSPALEAAIHEQLQKLEHFHDGIISCQVSLEARHQHHRQGNLFSVHIRLTVPGGEIVVTQDGERDHRHEDAYIAMRDAFRAARRQLEEHARKRRGEVKRHAERRTAPSEAGAAPESE